MELDRKIILQTLTEKGWGREDLADRAVLDLKTVNKAINGRAITPKTARKIAQALGKEVKELLSTTG